MGLCFLAGFGFAGGRGDGGGFGAAAGGFGFGDLGADGGGIQAGGLAVPQRARARRP